MRREQTKRVKLFLKDLEVKVQQSLSSQRKEHTPERSLSKQNNLSPMRSELNLKPL